MGNNVLVTPSLFSRLVLANLGDSKSNITRNMSHEHSDEFGVKTKKAGVGAVGKLSDLLSGPGFQFSQNDPSYQWRLDQGQKTIERSAAARGGVLGGGTLQALTRYGQDAAAQEYGNEFNRWRATQGDKVAGYSSLVGAGQTGVNQYLSAGERFGSETAGNLVDGAKTAAGIDVAGAKTAGDYRLGGAQSLGQLMMTAQGIKAGAITGGANAQAAGVAGSANAIGGALKGTSDTAQKLYLWQLLSKQQPKGGFRTTGQS